MRFRLAASNLMEWLALRSGRAPLPIGDVWLAIFQARAVMAAARLGIFEALADGEEDAPSVGKRTGLQPDAVEMVLRVLACTRYVRRRRTRADVRGTTLQAGAAIPPPAAAYELTRAGRRFLTRRSPHGLTGMMELQYFNLAWFGELEEVLRTGRGVDMHARLRGEADWDVYQRAMREVARLQAGLVARHVPIPERAERLLDIGGAHGLFAAALCRRRPGLRAEVLELPGAMPSAQRLAREEGVAGIVTHRAGDALHDSLGCGWDLIFAGNLLHHFQPHENRSLLCRARAATRERGAIAVWDLERPGPDRPPNLIGDGMALLFRVTSSGAVYAAGDYVDWLRAAGWSKVRVRRFLSAPGQVLVTARV